MKRRWSLALAGVSIVSFIAACIVPALARQLIGATLVGLIPLFAVLRGLP